MFWFYNFRLQCPWVWKRKRWAEGVKKSTGPDGKLPAQPPSWSASNALSLIVLPQLWPDSTLTIWKKQLLKILHVLSQMYVIFRIWLWCLFWEGILFRFQLVSITERHTAEVTYRAGSLGKPNACECTPFKGKQLSFNSRCHRVQLDRSCHFPFQFSGLFVCFFPPYHTTSRISFPWPGIDPTPLAVKAQSPKLWRASEFNITQLFYIYILLRSSQVVVHSLSCFPLFAVPGTAARRASLSFITSQSLLKCVESVTPPNRLILCRPALNLSQHQGLF